MVGLVVWVLQDEESALLGEGRLDKDRVGVNDWVVLLDRRRRWARHFADVM